MCSRPAASAGVLCLVALVATAGIGITAATKGAGCPRCLPRQFCDAQCKLTRQRIATLGLTPANAVECFTLFALGTQNYECPTGDGTWNLTNPNAVLFSERVTETTGLVIASHYFLNATDAGGGRASWEAALDGSRVTTTAAAPPVVASTDSPDGKEDNIPWLSTVTTSTRSGLLLGNIVAVVRAETWGGVAPPANRCNLVGRRTFVPYGAAYIFYAST